MAQCRSEEKRSFWRMAIQMQRESGLKIVEFCKQEGLKPASFFAWRRKLDQESAAGVSSRESDEMAENRSSSQLLPVRVVEDDAGCSVEVVAPGGFLLRVPSDAATANVRRVLQLLQEVS